MGLRLLGPVELALGEVGIAPSGHRQQVVLAMLGLNANRVTAVDQLVEAVWGEDPPSTARGQIQICISALRRMFSDAGMPHAIKTKAPGYVLELGTDELDSLQFTSLVSAAKSDANAGRKAEAAGRLADALRLWRGPALAGVRSELVERGAVVLDTARLAAMEERIRLDLSLGRHGEVCGELTGLVAEHPLRERLYELLMLALYRAGRQAEALEVGRSARERLIEEIGVEPGAELQHIEHAILNQDPSLDPPEPAERPASEAGSARPPLSASAAQPVKASQPKQVCPRQLPATIADFTGRHDHVDAIKAMLTEAREHEGFAVPVVAISGKGGVGKSTLAIRAAHEVGECYPDGQLYADLQAPNGDDRTAIVLARFLRALGVAGTAVPGDVEERGELFRSKLSGQRILVVLDDAASAEQVRALLPGSSTCAVIITSRAKLGGLPGASFIDIDVFDEHKSTELLDRMVGAERVRAEQDAASELVRFCAGLPLALRIAGARLASRPNWRISGLVHRLRDEAGRLDEFAHHGVELRSNIGLTYSGLDEVGRRLFRLSALIDAPDFPVWTAAALLDTSVADAEEVLETLVDAQLLDTVVYPDAHLMRYRFHTLIRVYAREQLYEVVTDDERRASLIRVLGGWLALAESAHNREYGGAYTIVHGDAPRWHPDDVELLESGRRALAWWESERQALVAAIRQAAAEQLDELCWDLALTSVTLFEMKGYFDDWKSTSQIALDVTQRVGNRRGIAAMLYSLGTLNMFQTRLDDAEQCFTEAAAIFREVGDEHGLALVLRNAANVDSMHGDVTAMMAKYERSLATLVKVGDRIGEAHVLRSQARYWIEDGDLDKAAELLERALRICLEESCVRTESQVVHRFAELYLRQGQIDKARQALHQVLRIVRDLGDRLGEAHALYGLGIVRQREGRLDTAEASMMHALDIARRIEERMIEAKARFALGELRLARGGVESAAAELHPARELFAELGSVVWLARTLLLLSEVSSAAGDGDAARGHHAEAVRMLSESDSPESSRLLTELGSGATATAEGSPETVGN
ncbi:AfsR/SARP family transcriptional regulator [Haloechinothrix halophila]|uniref:AfsR/SARP family transcriptional regulator n=1 Tax=Haloechinothrix halophila TaxID=1069073 RepID=UPI0006873EBF|nr:BTAD domain-containing putative transcriptional regulator [Haloechinothrix halophila]